MRVRKQNGNDCWYLSHTRPADTQDLTNQILYMADVLASFMYLANFGKNAFNFVDVISAKVKQVVITSCPIYAAARDTRALK
jgi:hypothetical protein